MSDFTAAFHLKTSDKNKVVDLFKRGKLTGYIFEPKNGWTTFVTSGDNYFPNPKVIEHNIGTLVYFERTNDMLSWGFKVFENDQKIGEYSVEGCDGEVLKTNNISEKSLKPLVSPSQYDELITLLHNETDHKMKEFQFAELIGLTNIEWVSYHQITNHPQAYDAIAYP